MPDAIPAEIPDVPLFPEGFGPLLAGILNPKPQPGPPYVHTIRTIPDCDLTDCCETYPWPCNCHRVQPTHTLETVDD